MPGILEEQAGIAMVVAFPILSSRVFLTFLNRKEEAKSGEGEKEKRGHHKWRIVGLHFI